MRKRRNRFLESKINYRSIENIDDALVTIDDLLEQKMAKGHRRSDIIYRAGDNADMLFDKNVCVIDVCRATGIHPDDVYFVRGMDRDRPKDPQKALNH